MEESQDISRHPGICHRIRPATARPHTYGQINASSRLKYLWFWLRREPAAQETDALPLSHSTTEKKNIPKDLLDIICILERDERHHSYKIVRNRTGFSLIAKFGAKNVETTPLKNNASAKTTARYQDKEQVSSEDKLCKSKRKRGKKKSSPRASGKSASQHTDKNQDSSNVGQAEQPKLKKKKTPAQVARDRDRRKSYWKRIKLARQLRKAKLRAENLAAYYAQLQEQQLLPVRRFMWTVIQIILGAWTQPLFPSPTDI